jgi:hypothetical protein
MYETTTAGYHVNCRFRINLKPLWEGKTPDRRQNWDYLILMFYKLTSTSNHIQPATVYC